MGAGNRSGLRADCANCFGLCCVATSFARSADFAFDKAAGEPCRHLRSDFGCGIHARLRSDGFRGCASFDCFGAGQRVAQVTFGGLDWRRAPGTAQPMYDALAVMRQLHELLWYLAEACERTVEGTLLGQLAAARDDLERMTGGEPETLLTLDVPAVRERVDELLTRVSALVRADALRGRGAVPPPKRLAPRADLVGASFRGWDLSGAHLRGALLIAADLRDARLHGTDLLGADLRDANLRGADLTASLFLTQPQLESAVGDGNTRLPAALTRPGHWAAAS